MEFIKKDGLKLINGGYLSNEKGDPVSHSGFVQAQQKAHYLVKLAEATKGKDYKGKVADRFTDTVDEVVRAINAKVAVEYVDKPEEPKMALKEQLAQEALSWIKFNEGSTAVGRINDAMQQFNVLKDFESFGLFFSTEIVKLEEIYTIEQILEAVKIVEPHLESINKI